MGALGFINSVFYFFVGLWPIIAKFGLAGIAVVCALGFAWFSPVFKKTALWVALAIVVYVVAYAVGVHDGEARVRAQWNAATAAAIDEGEAARADSERRFGHPTDEQLRVDPYNRDNHHK